MRKMEDPDVLSQALAEPTRRAILEQLRLGQKSVSELVDATARKQPNVSNHLAKMRRQGLVRPERIGRQVYYSIATPFVDLLLRLHEATADPMLESGAEQDETPFSTQIGSPPRKGLGGRSNSKEDSNSADSEDSAGQEKKPVLRLSGSTLHEWQKAYCHSMLEGQEDRATALVDAMLSRRLSMETIYIGVFQWGLNHIGEMYQRGETDAAHEHIASAITERMMARVAQFYSPVTRAPRRAIIACVPDNWHTLGLRMLADGLRGLGWDALFLGANTPSRSVLDLISTTKPDLVVLSCAMEAQWDETAQIVNALGAMRREHSEDHFLIALGGHYIAENTHLLESSPVDFSANNLSQFLNEVRRRFYHDAEARHRNGNATLAPPMEAALGMTEIA